MIDYVETARIAREFPGRCFLLVRHAARPPLVPEDPTFGGDLAITDEGRAQALACGRTLRAAGDPSEWAFLASPLRRTLLTADAVAEGIGSSAAVVPSPEIGIPGLWLTDARAVHDHQEREGSAVYCDRLMRDGQAEGFLPVPESTRIVLDWLRRTDFGTRRVFLCTHDVFLACLLSGLGCARVNSVTWVGYLQGAALFERPDGTFRAEYCVPDKASWRQPFVL